MSALVKIINAAERLEGRVGEVTRITNVEGANLANPRAATVEL